MHTRSILHSPLLLDLLMLENYAVLNYCGLSKILKKHDKCTGFVTREKFMMNMVVRQVRVGPVSLFLNLYLLFLDLYLCSVSLLRSLY